MTDLNIQTNFHSQVWNHVKQAVSTGSITKVKGEFKRSFDDIWADIKHEVARLGETTSKDKAIGGIILRKGVML